jgi:hypothetical protein
MLADASGFSDDPFVTLTLRRPDAPRARAVAVHLRATGDHLVVAGLERGVSCP